MKVSLNWLEEYISIDSEPFVLAEKLTMAGLEVETSEKRHDYKGKVVVAKVLEKNVHPNADKLCLCRVDAGTGQELQIVCGAPNVRAGMYVPCALEGAVLPGDFKIKAGKIRGELSKGMLCSAAELKLDSDASGIMELEGGFQPGIPIEDALKVSDVVFDIGLTPNRPDCLSMIGVAREIAAFSETKEKLQLPDFSLPTSKIGKESIHSHARVIIEDSDLCPRYTAGLLFNVKVQPSPFWLQDRLESIGLTPVNNIVDVTNFVMMETGQPLHAFDFDRLSKGTIIVRRAGTDKEFTTLDSKSHKMEPDMLMICDGEKAVALAGVMGGENSEIAENTTKVLIESAWFNPISIRKTAKRSGIATDASHRFERGTDPEGTVNAMKRAVSLIASLCDAETYSDFIDEYPGQYEPARITLSIKALNTRLGTEFDAQTAKTILESVEFKAEKTDEDTLVVDVPSFRVDVTRPEDLSEEVARLWGYNRIETSYPPIPAKGKLLSPEMPFRQRLRNILSGFSLSEVINYNFIQENSCDRLNLADDDRRRQIEKILNPISDQMSTLRSSLTIGLLEVAKRNIAQQTSNVRIFEIGKVFRTTTEHGEAGKLPEEKEMLAGLLSGNRSEQSWYSKKSEMDFYDIKGVVEGLLDALMIKNPVFEKIEDSKSCPYYKKGYSAFVSSNDVLIGSLGKIDDKVLKNFGLKQDAFIFDFSMDAIRKLLPDTLKAEALPKFPSISMDLTIIVDQAITVGEVQKKIEKMTEKDSLVENIFLFDLFEGEPLTEGKKSLSFRIIYRSETKTLKEKKILKHHQKISKDIVKNFGAELPS